jgi:putative SOS response-associated peptidase YedK
LVRDVSIATGTINAKSETAASKPAFRDPIKFRRCLIPADGLYQWARKDASKQPFCFEVKDGELFAFAVAVGGVEGLKRAMGKDVLDSDNNAKRRDHCRPRANANHA